MTLTPALVLLVLGGVLAFIGSQLLHANAIVKSQEAGYRLASIVRLTIADSTVWWFVRVRGAPSANFGLQHWHCGVRFSQRLYLPEMAVAGCLSAWGAIALTGTPAYLTLFDALVAFPIVEELVYCGWGWYAPQVTL